MSDPKVDKIAKWGFVALCLIAGGLIALAVSRCVVDPEPTLLRGCWTDGGTFVYGGEGAGAAACDGPERELRWPRSSFPLEVAHECADPDDCLGALRALDAATKEINRQVGRDVLVVQTDADAPDVNVVFGAVRPSSREAVGGSTRHRRSGGRMWATIEALAPSGGSPSLVHRVLVHELGHALGLAHDDFEDSAMHPVTRMRGDDGEEPLGIGFTDADRRALRRMLGDEPGG